MFKKSALFALIVAGCAGLQAHVPCGFSPARDVCAVDDNDYSAEAADAKCSKMTGKDIVTGLVFESGLMNGLASYATYRVARKQFKVDDDYLARMEAPTDDRGETTCYGMRAKLAARDAVGELVKGVVLEFQHLLSKAGVCHSPREVECLALKMTNDYLEKLGEEKVTYKKKGTECKDAYDNIYYHTFLKSQLKLTGHALDSSFAKKVCTWDSGLEKARSALSGFFACEPNSAGTLIGKFCSKTVSGLIMKYTPIGKVVSYIAGLPGHQDFRDKYAKAACGALIGILLNRCGVRGIQVHSQVVRDLTNSHLKGPKNPAPKGPDGGAAAAPPVARVN